MTDAYTVLNNGTNYTAYRENEECLRVSNTTYYYYRVMLEATESLDESGGLNWRLTLCLLLSWIIIFAITCKGVESMGKVRKLIYSPIKGSFCRGEPPP